MNRTARGLFLASLGCIWALLLAVVARGNDSPLATQEALGRRLAIQVLQNLKPIEQYIEQTGGQPAAGQPGKQLVEVTGNRVNLRAGPSTETSVLGSARQGEVFEYIKTEGDWHLIRMDEAREAYLSASFSRLIAPEETTQPSERIDPKHREKVRKILGDNKNTVDALQRTAADAQKTFDRRFNSKSDSQDADLWAATASMIKLHKYASGVTRQFERFSNLVGGGIVASKKAPVFAAKPSAKPSRQEIRAILRAGFGTNTGESKLGGVKVADADASRYEVSANVTADLSPKDRLNLSAGRSEEVRFSTIARTHATGEYARKLSDKAQVSANAGLRNFEDDNNDKANYDQTDFGVKANVSPSQSFNADASIGLRGTSYPNNDIQDYSDTRFGVGANGRAGEKTRWRLGYSSLAHDVDLSSSIDDNTQSQLEGEISFKGGERSDIVLGAETESYSFDNDNDARTYSRTGLKLGLRGRNEAGGNNDMTFELRKKNYDVNKDRNFTEIRGDMRSTALTEQGGRRETRFFANYRSYKGDAKAGFHNYVEARFDEKNTPGNGFFWESSLYGQYFFENNDIKRNALATQFLWLGLVLGANGTFQIGPHVATNTILVVEDTPADRGVFEHPNNTVRYGVKGAVNLAARPVRVIGAGRYELLNYYNMDGSPTPSRFELSGDGTYDVSEKLAIWAKLQYYATGSDDPKAVETTETDILLGLTYRIGGGR